MNEYYKFDYDCEKCGKHGTWYDHKKNRPLMCCGFFVSPTITLIYKTNNGKKKKPWWLSLKQKMETEEKNEDKLS